MLQFDHKILLFMDNAASRTKCSRTDQVKFMEENPSKIWGDMVCLSRPYSFKFFKGCLSQILLGPFLNTLSHFILRVSKMRSHVLSLVFLPKNATSKLQPLDAEIIKNFIVFYRKLLLQHVLVLLLSESKASDCLVNGSTEMRQKRTL